MGPANSTFGFFLVAIGGVMVGNCMLPLKRVRRWEWENVWLVFSTVSLVIVPWLLASLVIPHAIRFYRELSFRQMEPSLLFGAGWGVAQVLFGISVIRLGMALTFAIVVGIGTLLGTFVPVIVSNPHLLTSLRGVLLLAGTVVMILGLLACTTAGIQRESVKSSFDSTQPPREGGRIDHRIALGIAIVSGLLSAMLNYSLAFGSEIGEKAGAAGADPATSALAIWPVALFGGFVPNVLYSIVLLNRHRTWNRFQHVWPDAAYSSSMGLLWIGAVTAYGLATHYLGVLGTSVGWALYQIMMILSANVAGFATGEWKGAPKRAYAWIRGGLILLVLATLLIAGANL